jgi:hypothetical protein
MPKRHVVNDRGWQRGFDEPIPGSADLDGVPRATEE